MVVAKNNGVEAVHRAVRRSLEPLLGRSLRLLPAEELHLTLHFLGATDEDRVPGLEAALLSREVFAAG